MKTAFAIDIGGTKIFSALIDETGKIISDVLKNSTPKTTNAIEDLLKHIISESEQEFDTVAIATAGAVNNSNNAVIGSTGNLPQGYCDIDFKNLSTKPVFLENDANSAAWAEYRIGASKNTKVSILLTLGTGVGGGIIINNELLKGASGAAGEMHFKMYSDKRRKCTCGSWDCFEIYASGTALQIDAQEMTGNNDVTSYDVISGVRNGDGIMLKVFNNWQYHICEGIKGLVNIFNPDCIVLSGSMAQFLDVKLLEAAVNSDIVTTPTLIKQATTGTYSGMIGVSLLATERLYG